MLSKIIPVKTCLICGKVVSKVRSYQKYCSASCSAIATAKSHKTKFLSGLTAEQARRWYSTSHEKIEFSRS